MSGGEGRVREIGKCKEGEAENGRGDKEGEEKGRGVEGEGVKGGRTGRGR